MTAGTPCLEQDDNGQPQDILRACAKNLLIMQHFKWIWNFNVLCTAKILLFLLNFTTGFQSFAEKQRKYGLETIKYTLNEIQLIP